MPFPNGSDTPDGRPDRGRDAAGCLTAFDIGPDGSLSAVASGAATWPRIPTARLDAKCRLDRQSDRPGMRRIAQGGAVLEVIDTAEPCFACMLGGEDAAPCSC